jgi:hypothetical protein
MPTETDKKLDTVIRLLEDLYILQALTAKIKRDDIRAVTGVRTSRVSKIAQGLKRARGRTAEA